VLVRVGPGAPFGFCLWNGRFNVQPPKHLEKQVDALDFLSGNIYSLGRFARILPWGATAQLLHIFRFGRPEGALLK
jgi:hypothetical protein